MELSLIKRGISKIASSTTKSLRGDSSHEPNEQLGTSGGGDSSLLGTARELLGDELIREFPSRYKRKLAAGWNYSKFSADVDRALRKVEKQHPEHFADELPDGGRGFYSWAKEGVKHLVTGEGDEKASRAQLEALGLGLANAMTAGVPGVHIFRREMEALIEKERQGWAKFELGSGVGRRIASDPHVAARLGIENPKDVLPRLSEALLKDADQRTETDEQVIRVYEAASTVHKAEDAGSEPQDASSLLEAQKVIHQPTSLSAELSPKDLEAGQKALELAGRMDGLINQIAGLDKPESDPARGRGLVSVEKGDGQFQAHLDYSTGVATDFSFDFSTQEGYRFSGSFERGADGIETFRSSKAPEAEELRYFLGDVTDGDELLVDPNMRTITYIENDGLPTVFTEDKIRTSESLSSMLTVLDQAESGRSFLVAG